MQFETSHEFCSFDSFALDALRCVLTVEELTERFCKRLARYRNCDQNQSSLKDLFTYYKKVTKKFAIISKLLLIAMMSLSYFSFHFLHVIIKITGFYFSFLWKKM